jgi:hypothetical protein
MLGERLAFATRARKPTYSRRPGDSPFRRKLVFSRSRLELSNVSANCSTNRDERSDRCP